MNEKIEMIEKKSMWKHFVEEHPVAAKRLKVAGMVVGGAIVFIPLAILAATVLGTQEACDETESDTAEVSIDDSDVEVTEI